MLIKSLSDKINISSVNEILNGKKHEEVANIISQRIKNKVSKRQSLKMALSTKIKLPTINELLSGKQGVEVAKLYG